MRTLGEELWESLQQPGGWLCLPPDRRDEYEKAARYIRTVSEPKTPGEIAFRVYWRSLGTKAVWENAEDNYKAAWEAAAKAAIEASK